jgi:hypothetical protein
MTRTTPSRCMTLHLSHIFLTEARTFMSCRLFLRQQLNDTSAGPVVRRKLNFHPISRSQPYEICYYRASRMGSDFLFIV